jgi:hypothetical protein
MKKSILTISLVLIAATAYAASVHLKGGKNAEPTFFDEGLSLAAQGALSGLGNEDGLVTLEARGNPEAVCANKGSNEAPGQNPAEVVLTGVAPIDPDDFEKNGTFPFFVVTEEPESPIPGAPDCPNPNWTETITDVAFTSATITVEQPEGDVVLVVFCSIDPPSSDGQISAGDVSCTQG